MHGSHFVGDSNSTSRCAGEWQLQFVRIAAFGHGTEHEHEIVSKGFTLSECGLHEDVKRRSIDYFATLALAGISK
jgi:hypothetical protein